MAYAQGYCLWVDVLLKTTIIQDLHKLHSWISRCGLRKKVDKYIFHYPLGRICGWLEKLNTEQICDSLPEDDECWV